MFDLELEWMVGVGGGGRVRRGEYSSLPNPHPSPYFKLLTAPSPPLVQTFLSPALCH